MRKSDNSMPVQEPESPSSGVRVNSVNSQSSKSISARLGSIKGSVKSLRKFQYRSGSAAAPNSTDDLCSSGDSSPVRSQYDFQKAVRDNVTAQGAIRDEERSHPRQQMHGNSRESSVRSKRVPVQPIAEADDLQLADYVDIEEGGGGDAEKGGGRANLSLRNDFSEADNASSKQQPYTPLSGRFAKVDEEQEEKPTPRDAADLQVPASSAADKTKPQPIRGSGTSTRSWFTDTRSTFPTSEAAGKDEVTTSGRFSSKTTNSSKGFTLGRFTRRLFGQSQLFDNISQILPVEEDAAFEERTETIVSRMLQQEKAIDPQRIDHLLDSLDESYETQYIVRKYQEEVRRTISGTGLQTPVDSINSHITAAHTAATAANTITTSGSGGIALNISKYADDLVVSDV